MQIELYKHPKEDPWPDNWVIRVPEIRALGVFYRDGTRYIVYGSDLQENAMESSYLEFLVVLGMTEQDIRDYVNDKMCLESYKGV